MADTKTKPQDGDDQDVPELEREPEPVPVSEATVQDLMAAIMLGQQDLVGMLFSEANARRTVERAHKIAGWYMEERAK